MVKRIALLLIVTLAMARLYPLWAETYTNLNVGKISGTRTTSDEDQHLARLDTSLWIIVKINNEGTEIDDPFNVSVDGNLIQEGMTLLNGQTIATDKKGSVVIDLGIFGKLTIGPNSKVQVKQEGNDLRITCRSETCLVQVVNGFVQLGKYKRKLNSNESDTISEGDDFAYTGYANIAINYNIFELNQKRRTNKTTAGLTGLLIIIGVGAAVAVGIAVGSGAADRPGRPPMSVT